MEDFDSLRNLPIIAIYWGLVIQVLPFVIAAINRQTWSSFGKLVTTIVCCFVASAFYFVVRDGFNDWQTRDWVSYSLWICGGTAIFYRLYRPAVKEVEANVRLTG